MQVVHEFSELHVNQLHHLYQQEWWTKGRSLQDTQQIIIGSQVCIGLVNADGNLVGFTRVVTDWAIKALIFDVIVSATERGSGLGDQLIQLVKNHAKLRHVRHFELYCLPELCGFYARYGFSEDVGAIRLMRCVNAQRSAR